MGLNTKNIVITSALRTAIGTFGGSLKNIQANALGASVVKASIKKSNLNSENIDELIMGQVLTSATGQNPARQAAIQAGMPIEKTAIVINQVCGSGLRSIAAGYQAIMSNDSKIVIAGGQESMSNAPHAIHFRNGKKLDESKLIDTMIKDGLWDAFNGYHMGVTAENVAAKWQITRKDQDDFALSSQTKAEKAQKEGKFENEIVPVIYNGKNQLKIDEHPRAGMTMERLTKLKPSFKNDGTVTPGNASGINDGAAAVVLMSDDEAKKRNLTPLATIVSWATCGVDPSLMGSGPIPASKKALKKAGWEIKDGKRVNSETGEELKFEILLISPAFERIVLPFKKNLERMGIEASVRVVDTSQYVNRIRSFDFDVFVMVIGQSLSPGNEQDNYWSCKAAETSGARNYMGICNPAIDKLIRLVIEAPDRNQLIYSTRALDRALLWGHYLVPHWHINYYRLGYWNKFSRPEITPKYSLGFFTWWVDKEKQAILLNKKPNLNQIKNCF